MQRAPQWLKDGTVRALAQFTLSKPYLPNVPLASDLPPTQTGKRAIELLAADSLLAWPLLGPQDLPTERVRELRTAFSAMMKDPELLAEAAKQGLEIDPVSGQEMQELVDRLHTAAPEVVELVKKIVAGR
jgi:tripartite-type tricarboxylate transporter receptor subunit TctC